MKKKRRQETASPSGARPEGGNRLTSALFGLGLILVLTFVVYLPILKNGFTDWDDTDYVKGNPLVARPDLGAILTTPFGGNYHPLTVLSLAVNYRIWGDAPGSYHAVNLGLHLANTALVFGFIWMLSRGRWWTSLVTSLFFGIHPMHVESVAWIAERKDVLYTLFYLLSLIAYLTYLEGRRVGWLALCLVMFVLSMAAKPAAVVLPLTLLALDFFRARQDRVKAVAEKIPFLVLSLVGGLLTLKAQKAAGAVAAPEAWSLFEKVLFASYGSVMYVVKMFVPAGLSAIYPYPKRATGIGPEFYAAFAVALVAFPALLFVCRRLRPVIFGCAFFFINIVLVLQFVSVGQAIMADRYTYVPYIGLFLALAWWLDEPAPEGSTAARARAMLFAIFALLLPVSVVGTWARGSVWKNAETLWSDAIAKFPGRIVVAHSNLGIAYADQGRFEDAITQYRLAIQARDDSGKVRHNLGLVLAQVGRSDEAIAEYREALRLDPAYSPAHNNLGIALAAKGDYAGAATAYREAIRLDPANVNARHNLGIALAAQGKLDEAIEAYRGAIARAPDFAPAHNGLGVALASQGRLDEAIAEYRRVIQLQPRFAAAHNNLGLALERRGLREDAIRSYRESIRLDDTSRTRTNLGRVFVNARQFEDAQPELERALQIDPRNADAERLLTLARQATGRQ